MILTKFILPIIFGVGFLQAIILSVMLLLESNAKTSFMALLLMALGVLIGSELFDLFRISLDKEWSSLFMSLDLTYGPLIWLLSLSMYDKKRRFKRMDFGHFIPFLVSLAVLNSSIGSTMFSAGNGAISQALVVFVCFKLLIITAYLIMIHRKLVQSKGIKDNEKLFANYVVWSSTFVFAVSYGVFFIMYFGIPVLIDSDYLACILVTFLVYLLTYLILRNPDIFFQKRPFGPKYSNSNISDKDRITLQNSLEKLLGEEQLFLKADLTLAGLAENLEVSPNVLSQVINEGLKKNFYDVINEYRVGFMKEKLLDPKEKHKKILALAFESGFQSKASFNRIFKKITGMTPIQFRESNRSHPTE